MSIQELADGQLLFERADGVATITLNRPEKKNALSPEIREGIEQAVLAVRDDAEIRALIIAGAGGCFCAGGDLANIRSVGLDTDGWRNRLKALHAWLPALLQMEKVVISAVTGPAYGAGFSLALTADFILAAPSARFNMSFLRIGGVPDWGGLYTLPRIVGPHKAKEIMLSTREIKAEEAKQLGVVSEIVPEESLMERARAIASAYATASPTAVALTKRALSMTPGADLSTMLDFEANAQALAFASDAHREAIDAFLNKQPMPFQFPKA